MIKFISLIILITTTTICKDCVNYIEEKIINNFILVVDISGSMRGAPINKSIHSINKFIGNMQKKDFCSIITFNDEIKTIAQLTNQKEILYNSINNIEVTGQTHLIDALAKAIVQFHNLDGQKIVIYLTDGKDTGSILDHNSIKKIASSEAVFLYGIGIGEVEKETLLKISEITGGSFFYLEKYADIENVYQKVLNDFYSKYRNPHSMMSRITIKSIPSGKNIFINNEEIGITPLTINYPNESIIDVGVLFNRGEWKCQVPLRNGMRAVIDAREDEVGYDVKISTTPKDVLVFCDNTYIGLTSLFSISEMSKISDVGKKLVLGNIAPGDHKLKFVMLPDFNYDEKPLEFSLNIDRDLDISVNMFSRKIEEDGKVIYKERKFPY